MTGLTPEENEAIKSLSVSELLKLHEDTSRAIIALYRRIIICYELLEEGGEDLMAVANLPAILAGIKRLDDEAARLQPISLAARQEAIKKAHESN